MPPLCGLVAVKLNIQEQKIKCKLTLLRRCKQYVKKY